MSISAVKSKFPAALITGIFFVAVLLTQILCAQIGRFGLVGGFLLVVAGALLAIVAAGSLLVTWLRTTTAPADKVPRSISKTGIACAILAAAASVTYMVRWVHPTENIMGGYDEGIYAITAAHLAQTGQYRLNAVLLPSLPTEVRPWTIAQFPRMANRTEKLPPSYPCYHACLFIADEQTGTLVSQFPVGFPTLLGSAHSVFGFAGQRYVNPILLFTAACLAGALVTSWLGMIPGSAAFILWLWFPLQVWAGNTRFAEVLLQLLWLLTLVGLADRSKNPGWASVLSGLALGVSLAIKIDALPVVAITAVVVAVATYRNERAFFRKFFMALSLSAAISAAALWEDNRAYALDTLRSIAETNRRPLVYCSILIAVGALAWAGARRFGYLTKARDFWPKLRPWIMGGMIGGGMALAAYAYFIRSHPAVPDTFFYWPQDQVIRSYREATFVRLGWYWRPWGLAIAVLGMGAAMRHPRKFWQGLAVGIGLLFLISFVYDIRNNPKQPYALRRFLPYAIPFMIMGAVFVEGWLPRTWVRARSWLTVAITAGLVMGFWPINDRLNAKTEYAGLINQVGPLAAKIPSGAVILVSEFDPLARLASCLEFVYGKPCLIVRGQLQTNETGDSLRRACALWKKQGRLVYALSADAGETFRMSGVTAYPADHGNIKTSVIQASTKELVTEQTTLDMPYTLNEIRLSAFLQPPATPHYSPKP